jgi:uncharacterized protein (TIGR03435 family)
VQTVQRKVVYTNMSMGGLVNNLSNIIHVPVVGRPELSGRFNFTLDLTFYPEMVHPNTPVSAEASRHADSSRAGAARLQIGNAEGAAGHHRHLYRTISNPSVEPR